MKNIRINTDLLRTKIEQLRTEKKKIDDAMGVIFDDTAKIENIWSGNCGDVLKEDLTEYSTTFEKISYQLEKYIYFLEKVAELYEKQDSRINSIIDNSAAINYK